jgi:hypothetical protein
LQSFVDFLLLLAGGATRGLRGFVLILLRVQFQIEQAGQVATRVAATASAAALSERIR